MESPRPRPTPLQAPWPTLDGTLTFNVVVPEILLPAPSGSFEDWKILRRQWNASGREEPSTMGPYESLVRGGRMHTFTTEQPGYGWPEAFTALALEQAGWTCWTAVQLFPVMERPVHSSQKKRVTEEVERLLEQSGLPIPRLWRSYVDFVPKNPDLVCYHADRRKWRFCEVKRNDGVKPEQINALAYLAWLTGAKVAIVRVVPDVARRQPRTHTAGFVFTGKLPVR